ncbi:MAG TPA: hypothetical protein PLF40_00430 [Kofleriaceae bacterium]|nr:hypothetical protein [Kofleriaceae bacterium]
MSEVKLGKLPMLRFGGDVSKLRMGGVYVQTANRDEVIAGLTRFWSTLHGELQPGEPGVSDDVKSTGEIGYAVLPPGLAIALDVEGTSEPWVGVYDSARYAQEAWLEELRQALHLYTGKPTFSFYVYPVKLSAGTATFSGKTFKPCKTWRKTVEVADRFPYPFAGYAGKPPVEDTIWLRAKVDFPQVLRRLEFEPGFWKA